MALDNFVNRHSSQRCRTVRHKRMNIQHRTPNFEFSIKKKNVERYQPELFLKVAIERDGAKYMIMRAVD